MRTTLDIDDDVLRAAKELASRERLSAGQVVSRLLREAFTGRQSARPAADAGNEGVAGFRPFGPRGSIVTDEQVNTLRDREGV